MYFKRKEYLCSWVNSYNLHLPISCNLFIEILDRLIDICSLFPQVLSNDIKKLSLEILDDACSLPKNIVQMKWRSAAAAGVSLVRGIISIPFLLRDFGAELLLRVFELLARLGSRGLLKYAENQLQEIIDDSFNVLVNRSISASLSWRWRNFLELIQAVSWMVALGPITVVLSVTNFALTLMAVLIHTIRDILLLKFTEIWRNASLMLDNLLDTIHKIADTVILKMVMPILGLPFELLSVILKTELEDPYTSYTRNAQYHSIDDMPTNSLPVPFFSRHYDRQF